MPPPFSKWRSPIPTQSGIVRGFYATQRDDERKGQMYREFYEVRDRVLRRQAFADRVTERRRSVRRLFALAVAAERRETWNAV